MHIFVSGATGVIGRRVVPMLLAQGHSVTAVAHHPPSPSEEVGAKFVPVDLFTPIMADMIARGADLGSRNP